MIDQLRSIAIFRAVTEAGSFRAAAKVLNLSPSVVSYQVTQLENHLGTALLYRSTRKISLTDDGKTLFASAGKMINAAEQGLDSIHHNSDQPEGRLRISVPAMMFGTSPFIDHLSDFAKKYPKIDMAINFSDKTVELVGSPFDAAIRTGWLKDSQYKARKLFEFEHVMVVSPAYLAGKAMPKSIVDMEDWGWIKLSQFPLAQQIINSNGKTPSITPKVAIEVDSVAALCKMAENGMGIACVPRFLIKEELRNGNLIALTPNWDLLAPGSYVVWPNNVSPESLTMRFVHFLVDRLAQKPATN